MKSCLNPAATPGEPHPSASPWPTSPPPPNNCEQPTNPHRVTLVLTPGPPTSSPMKEPSTPRPPNSREYQKYVRLLYDLEPQISALDPKELVGTDHPTSCPLSPRHSGAHQSTTRTCLPTDATLRNTTSTRASYAARTNLAPPTPTNEEGPATFTTSAGIRARSREEPSPTPPPHHPPHPPPPPHTPPPPPPPPHHTPPQPHPTPTPPHTPTPPTPPPTPQ
ncbi:hypothetical protein E4T56_gene8261, partial [Termitomyces sp. T112]